MVARVISIKNGEGAAPHAAAIVDTLTLDHAARHVRRRRFTCDGGTEIALDLPAAAHLREGDRLVLEDDREIAIRAAVEPLLEVRPGADAALAALAWHLGNRHVPISIGEGRIVVARDAVLMRMLEGLGATLREVDEPFEPVSGAYHHHDHQ